MSDDSIVREYKIGDGEWTTYTNAVTMSANGTVYFRGQDTAGNWSDEINYEVTNIDREGPILTITGNATEVTAKNVTLTATASDGTIYYSLDNTSWTVYDEALVIDSNKTVYFKAVDAACNVTTTHVVVDKIDKVSPAAPRVSADVTKWTNGKVQVSATPVETGDTIEYFDGHSWLEYTSAIEFTQNGTIQFRAVDGVGNISEVTTYTVSNIDTTAPVNPLVHADVTTATNKDVIVSAIFSDDSIVREYKIGDGEWTTYTNAITMSTNGTVYFRGQDTAGNWSDEINYEVTNIDREGPAVPVAVANVTELTADEVIVTAEFSEDSVVKQYSRDGAQWLIYVDGVTFDANGVVLFRGVDEAGNVSEITSYTVSNIVKESDLPPPPPTVSEGVIVYGTFSEEAVTREYSFDGKNWLAYPEEGVRVIRTGMIYFRSLDDIGNVISTTEEKITTIPDENDWNDLKANGPEGKVDQMGVLHEGTIVAGHVGFGDQIDYYEFTLKSGACLNFYVESSDTAKFTIYSMSKSYNKSGDVSYSLKELQMTSVSAGYTVPTEDLLLSEGTYYVAMSANNSKTSGDANYRISVKESTIFYTKGDQTDNWNDMNEAGADGAVGDAGVITETGFANKLVSGGWVGYGDSVDYVKFTLEDAAKVNFNVSSSDNLKFTVYRLDEKYNSRTGVSTYKINALQTASVQSDHTIMTKDLLLEAGTYYIGITSPNAAKGGNADYNVWLNSDHTKFFTMADNSDEWTDLKTKGANGAVAKKGELTADTEVNGWVGFSDNVDYMEFTLDSVARVSFDLESSDAAKFTVYQLEKNKNGTFKLKVLQNTTLKAPRGTKDYTATSNDLWLSNGTYYISMTSTNAKKGGDADYSFKVSEKSYFSGHKADATDNTWELMQNDDAVKLDCIDINGWVGYSDAADFVKLELDGSGVISLELDEVTATAYERKELKITCVNEKGKAIALTYNAATDSFTSKLTFDEGTVCYVGVTTTNQLKYDTEYQITARILA